MLSFPSVFFLHLVLLFKRFRCGHELIAANSTELRLQDSAGLLFVFNLLFELTLFAAHLVELLLQRVGQLEGRNEIR